MPEQASNQPVDKNMSQPSLSKMVAVAFMGDEMDAP